MRRFLARSHLSLILAGLLLVPLAGVANGASRTVSSSCVPAGRAFALARPDVAIATCIVDQYGNVYSFTIQGGHQYLYGTVTTQGCVDTTWPITGSYVIKNGIQLEITAANPDPSDTACVPMYTLKGKYPHAAWYYITGFAKQAFTYQECPVTVKHTPLLHGGQRG